MATIQYEVIQKGYQALVDALGVADAARFIQHFSPGQGNYTEERRQLLGSLTLEDTLAQMQQAQVEMRATENLSQYGEVIE
ncbi:MAG: hypothetical protein AAF283_01940 [Cyanobacteria bacterium P01_A01_bin.70]